MALTWNLEGCSDHESLLSDEEWPITNVLIWATIAVGMGEITEANAAEFFARVKFTEQMNGPFLRHGGGDPYWITPADVRKRVGMGTNVSNETRAKFMSRFRHDLDASLRQYEREIEKTKVA